MNQLKEVEKEKKYYLCTNCGFSPTNRATWCDLGCGSDYNEMVEIRRLPEFLAKHATAIRKEVAGALLKYLEDEYLKSYHEDLHPPLLGKLRQRYLGSEEGKKK